MSVRKLITRILNLVYLGAAAFAIFSMATAPLASVHVKLDIEAATLLEMIPSNGAGGSGSAKVFTVDSRAVRANEPSSDSIMGMLTDPEIIDGAFDTIHLDIPVELPSLMGFLAQDKEEQPKVVSTVVNKAIPVLKEQIKQPLSDGLPLVMERVAKKLAQGAIEDAIKGQIEGVLGGGGDIEGAFANVTTEQITGIVDNVWDALTDTETTPTVDTIVETLQESVNDVLLTLGQSQVEGFTDGSGNPIQIEAEDMAEIKNQMTGLLQGAGLADEDGNILDIEQALASLLAGLGEMMGGGTSSKLSAPVVTWNEGSSQFEWEAVANADTYTVKVDGEEAATQTQTVYSVGEQPEEFSVRANPASGSDYESSDWSSPVLKIRAFRHRAEGSGDPAPTLDDTLDTLLDSLINMIPMETISGLNLDEMLGIENLTMYAYIGIVALCAFPWLLFALITLIRTLRPKKCWTKPWVVFFFAFLQIIFGAVITIGVPLAWTFIMGFLSPVLAGVEKVGPLLTGLLAPEIKFMVLMPSYVYLAMIPFTILYAIFAHGPKKEFKQWKRDRKAAKKAAKAEKAA